MNWKKSKLTVVILGLLIVVGVVPRFLWLDRSPNGMSHDELEYVLSAKSYFQNGTDLSGFGFPQSIIKTNTNGIISFLPAMIMAPFYGKIDLSQQNIRLPYIIINLLTAVVLFLIVKELLLETTIGLTAVVVFLFNPWSFYLSRVASDTPFALLFCLIGIWLILKKGKVYTASSFVFFGLSFFAYHGAKPLIPLLVIALCIYKLPKKTALIFIGCFSIMTLSYFVALKITPNSISNSRQSDVVFLNSELLAKETNRLRGLTVENKLTPIFVNKATVAINIFFKNYITSFSPEVLFTSGDTRSTYSFVNYGLLNKIDLIFLGVGMVGLFLYKKKIGIILTLMGLLAPMATGLSTVGVSVVNRSFLLMPILVIFIAFGIYKLGKWSLVPLLGFWGYFLFFYFWQFPKINQEAYFLSERVAANYIKRDINNNVEIITADPRSMYLETYFYTNSKENLGNVEMNKERYTLGITTFTNRCSEINESGATKLIHISKSECLPKNQGGLSITEEEFGGALFKIINDKKCSNFELSPWVNRRLEDYKIEGLSDKTFCERWITNLYENTN